MRKCFCSSEILQSFSQNISEMSGGGGGEVSWGCNQLILGGEGGRWEGVTSPQITLIINTFLSTHVLLPPPLWCMFKLFTYLTLLLGVSTELCPVHLAPKWGCKCFHVSVVS